MNGKKFVYLFLILIIVSAIGISAWMKQGYDSRPNINIKNDNVKPELKSETHQEPQQEAQPEVKN
jgi:Na+-transporting methylmalonyl-CoA/oxaloacetate decarboxylase gamma subunit